MILGVTGTRKGMNEFQKQNVLYWLSENKSNISEMHFGDCIGVDAELFDLCRLLGIKTYSHPPTNPKHRAFCNADIIYPEQEYLVRNCRIVDVCDVLIAFPKYLYEEQRSGTWHAIRYALGKKPVHVFYTNGDIIFGLSKV
jgi:hypothetical protein